MQIRDTIEGATGYARSAALATGNRAKALTSQLIERIQPSMTMLAGLASAFVGVVHGTVAAAAERMEPLTSWLAERLRPWAALMEDVRAVLADLLRNAAATAADLARPLIARVTDRYGVRMTVVGAASVIFVGSTGSTAWAIASMDEPAGTAPEQIADTTVQAVEVPEEPDAAPEEEAAPAAEAEKDEKKDEKPEEPAEPEPVGNLNEDQMENAVAIIEAGKDEGLDEDGWVVALATAMQESKFKNYANEGLPESFEYDYQAVGSDHDSVGLFQQRPASGWGSVEELMDPKTSASKFYDALKNVDGWEDMPVTVAAQTVQVSAFPDHYAQWVDLAWDIVESYEEAHS